MWHFILIYSVYWFLGVVWCGTGTLVGGQPSEIPAVCRDRSAVSRLTFDVCETCW